MEEAALLHGGAQLGAEPGGQRRFVHDEASTGLLDRGDDGVDIERDERAQVDDLGIDALLIGRGLRDVHERAVREHREVGALPVDAGLAELDRVVAVRHVAQRVLRPWHDRPLVMAVERAVVDPLRFEEDHRVVVLDRRDQQALRVVRVRDDDGLQAGDVGEQRLGALRVGLAAVDAAAGRHADHERRVKSPADRCRRRAASDTIWS